jgi:polysaccharide biosynthesis transport protein
MSTNAFQNPRGEPAEAGTDSPGSLLAIWTSVRKHWITVVGVMLMVALSVAFYTLGQAKVYQASATVQFDPNPPRPLGKDVETVVDMGAGNYWNNREYYETQYKIIQSIRIARSVVQQLDLSHDPAFLALGRRSKNPNAATVQEDAIEVLRTRLNVQPVKESRLAVVTFEDTDPARAQRILAAVIDAYVQQNLDDALVSTGSAVDWLRGQLSKIKDDLESSEMKLHEFKLEKNMLSVAFDDQNNMLRESMKQLNDGLTAVRAKREEVGARRAQLSRVAATNPSELPATELLQSPLLQVLRQRYEEAVRERESLVGSGKGMGHPDVAAAEARVGAARTALFAEVRNIRGAVDKDLAAIGQQEGGLSKLLENAKKQALDLNLLEIEYNRLRRSKTNTEKLYQLLLERTKESELTRMLRVNNIRVVDRPIVPRVPIRPRVPTNVVLGILAGIIAGVLAAMGRDLLDRSIKTPEDVTSVLGLSFLGMIPKIDADDRVDPPGMRKAGRRGEGRKGKTQLIVHEHPSSGIAEASRGIRTNLMFMAPDRPCKVLLVTSAAPMEGKTTVACCIATVMAQAGQRVALIDCDLRRPSIHRVFAKSTDVGLTTAFLDESVLTDEVVRTEVPNLSVIPAGPIPPNPAELIQSERFRQLLDTISSRFDRIVIDSPPVVAVTDAAILSTMVDSTVLVVRAFKTTKELARQARRALGDVGARTAGVVLNWVDLNRHEYSHYYYYKREGYYAEPEKAPTAS